MTPSRFLRFLARPRRSGMHVASGRMLLASEVEQEPAEQQVRVLSDLAAPFRAVGRLLAWCGLGVAVLAIAAAARCPRARADEPRLPTLSEQVADFERLEARLLAGRIEVARLEEAARVDRVAALHFNDHPNHERSTRGAEAWRTRSASAPVAGSDLESIVGGRSSARFQVASARSTQTTHTNLPGAAANDSRSRRALSRSRP